MGRREIKVMVSTVIILLLENLFFPLVFRFLVEVGFAIPGPLSRVLILAWDARCLRPTFPGKNRYRARRQRTTRTRTNPVRGSPGGDPWT